MINPKTLSKLKPGTRVYFTQEIHDFYKEHGWSNCTVGGMLDTQQHANTWFVDKAIAEKLPYKAKFIRFKDNVGEKEPGAFVECKVGSCINSAYYSFKNLSLKKPRIK